MQILHGGLYYNNITQDKYILVLTEVVFDLICPCLRR